MIPIWVRMTMNVLLVIKTAYAAVSLYRQNEKEILTTLTKVKLRKNKKPIIKLNTYDTSIRRRPKP